MFKKVVLLLLDSMGVGELPDAESYGDTGCNTVYHVLMSNKNIEIPNLQRLGLLKIIELEKTTEDIISVYGKCKEKSAGKDSVIGHWELMGVFSRTPFLTCPQGFPEHIVEIFKRVSGCRDILGNYSDDGISVIKRFGELHRKTGYPIIYTSVDSVFQIAVDVDVVPLDKLYEWCEKLRGEFDMRGIRIARIIARPFMKKEGEFVRIIGRKDFTTLPKEKTYIEKMADKGAKIVAIGKTYDIFSGKGFSLHVKTSSNEEGLRKTLEYINSDANLIFTNLVDFDMIWGHRRDVIGYGNELMKVDAFLPKIMEALDEDDLLIITADHGCDPTFRGTDHTREYIPIMIWHKKIISQDIGVRETFADVGATIASALGMECEGVGASMADLI